ncbi:hypothetical protein ACQPZX_33220 [Actinoplanes sp. CA-142083]|uniref:hypothetical protein n=1 Tax=Actinoplanes sp. CA-142083 TaxID=3239903 RepID=UPI003D8A8DF9
MSLSRYGARTAGFALLYLLALVAGDATDGVVWPAAAVGAIWLVAQAGLGPRRFDMLAMMVLSALVPMTDDLLAGLSQAVPQVVPAVLFAWLLERWLPGYWRGHGDRFRRRETTLARLAGAAASAAAAGAILQSVALIADFDPAEAGYALVRDTVTVLAAVLLARLTKQRIFKNRPAEQRSADQRSAELAPGKGGRPRLTIVR